MLTIVETLALPIQAACAAAELTAGFMQRYLQTLLDDPGSRRETSTSAADDGNMCGRWRGQVRIHVRHASQSLRIGVSEVREFSTFAAPSVLISSRMVR